MEYRSLTLTNFFICDRAEFLQRITLLLTGVIITIIFLINLLQINDDDSFEYTQPATEMENPINDVPQGYEALTPSKTVDIDNATTSATSSTSSNITVKNSASPLEATTPAPVAKPATPINSLQPQLSVIKPVEKPIWKNVTLQPHESLKTLFHQIGINPSVLATIENLPQVYTNTKHLPLHTSLNFLISPQHELKKLILPLGDNRDLIIENNNGNYSSEIKNGDVFQKIVAANLTINGSLYLAAQDAKVSPRIILGLSTIFGDSINFLRDIHSGDNATILYEEDYKNGKPLHAGNILAAQIHTRNKNYQVIRYLSEGATHYFTPLGKSLKRGFDRFPLHFTRISSPFNPMRMHPILHILRPHYGVDLSAPYGSPIHATGDGKIIFAGRKGGYGNEIEIQHSDSIATIYGHLSHFASNIKPSTDVKAGEIIGYVGMSGLATGPHLHYEFRIHGKAYNPLAIALPFGSPIEKQDKPDYLSYARKLMSLINTYGSVHISKLT